MIDDDLPFFALVGNNESPLWGEAAIAFITFYHHMFNQSTDIAKAVLAMRAASANEEFNHTFGSDAKQAWIDYMQEQNVKAMQSEFQLMQQNPGTYVPPWQRTDERPVDNQ
tara:strand:- start:34 stop:366 length:333 start_codon:yes stop_codon:yes gene_type:complete